MKPIFLLIALAGTLHAELLATFHTTQGNVVVLLQYDTAPQAVANFITLAQGTRPWVDSSTGRIRREPFYNGIKIHRTANDGSFKFAQGGSPRGDGSDGPGYTFKDEFSPAMTHVPYVFSMANSGPNSNGSQFFLTGSLAQPTFNNVHTILGLVTDPASRAVVDAMIAAGPNGTIINGIAVSRTDAAAVAFDGQAQDLPIVSQPAGNLVVSPGVSASWSFQSPMTTGDVLQVFRSHTLADGDWDELPSSGLHVGIGSPLLAPALGSAGLDNASAQTAFYNLSIARHPGSVAPSSLSNRTILVEIQDGLIYYVQNPAGSGGNATFVSNSGISFDFAFNTYNFGSGGHDVSFIAENIGITPDVFLIKVGCDSANDSQINGHHTIQAYNFNRWTPFSSGLAAISR